MEHTLEISGLSEEHLRKLDARASQSGMDRSSYARHLLEQSLDSSTSLAEFLSPLHDFTEDTGVSEKELHRFLATEVEDSRRERRNRGDSHGR